MSSLRTFISNLTTKVFLKKFKKLSKKAFSEKYLLFTNATISLCLSATGDILEQRYEKFKGEINEWNHKRTINMAISGISVGIVCHYWYKFLDHHLPGKGFKIVMKKVLADQFICSPIVITVFFVTLAILEKQSLEQVQKEVKNKAWKLYAAEWMIWPIAQIINFYYLPSKYRVLYDNTISLGYDVFTSNVKYDS